MIKNVLLTNSAVVDNSANENKRLEIKVGKTVYSVKHKWKNADISDLISDYIAEKIKRINTANAA